MSMGHGMPSCGGLLAVLALAWGWLFLAPIVRVGAWLWEARA